MCQWARDLHYEDLTMWDRQVIITSFLFPDGKFSQERLEAVLKALDGDKNKLVIDLSCRRTNERKWHVAMNKWQKITDMEVNQGRLLQYSNSQLISGLPSAFQQTRSRASSRTAPSSSSTQQTTRDCKRESTRSWSRA